MNRWVKEQEIPLGEILYLLSFAPLLIAKGIGLYDGQKIFTCFAAAALAFGIGKLFITTYSARDIFIISLLIILSLTVYKQSCEKGILFYVWMIIGMKNVRLKEVMRWGLKIWCAAFGFIMIYSLFNLHDTIYKIHSKMGLGHMFRWSLGYPHPNVLHISYLILLLFIVYNIREKFNWKICLWMFLGNCYIFMYSVSYTGFAITALYLAGNLYWSYRKKLVRAEQIICECIFPACVLLSIAGPLLLTGKAFDIVNKILNTRLYLSGLFLKKENITLFGNNIGQLTNATQTMDNSYVYALIAYGILVFALITAGYILLIHRYIKQQKGIELLIIFAVLAAGLTEPFLFNTSYKNITLLFLGAMIFTHKEPVKREIGLRIGNKPLADSKIKVKTLRLSDIRGALREHSRGKKMYFTAVSTVIAMVCVVIYTGNAADYRGCVVPRVHCADIAETETYIDENSLENYSDYLILDYENGSVPVEIFEGTIMKAELFRAAVSLGILVFLISYFMIHAVFCIYNRRTKVRSSTQMGIKMKIAMIGQKRIPSREGGVEVVVTELSTRLSARGYCVEAYNRSGYHVSGKEFDDEKGKLYKGTRIITVPTFRNGRLNAIVYTILATLRAVFGKYDVIHYHAEGPCIMLWLPRLLGIRVVATIHGLDWQRAKWGNFASYILKLGERTAAKYADEIIVLSRNLQDYFKETYQRDTHFIPNGVKRPAYREIKEIKKKYGLEKEQYILFVARLVPEKGLHYLIEAFRMLQTDKKLVIAGGSSHSFEYMEKIKKMAALDKRIIMTDFVQGRVLEELYSNACFFVLPSDIEGMAISLLEAMSYGCCCVVSDIEENMEVVEDGAVTFKKGNKMDLRGKMDMLLKNPEMVEKYKAQSGDFICSKYNWDDVLSRTLALYTADMPGSGSMEDSIENFNGK